ncbi:hypothetical protein [Fusobacterium periodonticum]|uniref:Lipoprotein n=2 Tax=Fusobacterium periodonticum TaxID=860 RepID=A0AAD0HVD9_9FUSO|nr:hypothetical protein [Fusobacterium periodonticum]AVQ25765.1 hypothetical protein C4N17_08830 [Fusobacterium periodonticum]KGE61883.1 hypothetical protein FSAG_002083 [Fusobacterium periodonticum 2_1_31]
MIKKMIILIIMGLTLSSCQLFTEAIKDNIHRYEMEQETKERHKKNGGGAISVDKYKEGVEATIKDILKRPINKRIQFEEAVLLTPENTELNKKVGNIVDMKTGYGIPIYIINDGEHCSQLAFTKRVNGKYYKISYLENNIEISKIAQKIIKENGFTKGCK